MHSPITTSITNPAIGFTTPQNYATRLCHLLSQKSLAPLWCPTIITQPTPQTLSSIALHLSPPPPPSFSAILFPSRTAITAFSAALLSHSTPLFPPHSHDVITVGCLGKDAELIDSAFLLNITCDIHRIKVLVPPISTPSGLVQSLGAGNGGRVLCLVPKIVGLEEPPVVPDFLRELEASGWVPTRVNAYETRWLGPNCAEGIITKDGDLGALIFTSSAEVEGLLKSLREFGWDWKTVRERWPELVVAAHGPVTAAGAQRLGVDVDVVSDRFSSFDGVVDAVYGRLHGLRSNCL